MRVIFVKLTIVLLSMLPLLLAHALGGFLGRIAFLLPNSLKDPMKKNIELCFPGHSNQQKHDLYKESFIELYRSLAEMGALWLWRDTRILSKVKHVDGTEHLEKALKKGKGVILALPHLGSWEILGLYFASKYPFTALYKPVKSPELDTLVKTARERNGARLVATDKAGVRKLIEALSANELVAILPDQDPGRKGSIFAPFCGIPASTMTLLPRLTHKTGAALLFCYAERLPGGQGFQIHILPGPVETLDRDLGQAATQLNQGVEHCLRRLPQQYQWGYKRFKTRPAGEERIY